MKRGKNPVVQVGEFYARHAEVLQMKLIGPALGFDRKIREPTINRPGLALSGFFIYFAGKRIQVLGNAEVSYLKSLEAAEQENAVTNSANSISPVSLSPAVCPSRKRWPIQRHTSRSRSSAHLW